MVTARCPVFAEPLDKAWDRYIESPSDVNAGRVARAVPRKGPLRGKAVWKILDGLDLLGRKALEGDENAVKCFLSFARVSDDRLAEDVAVFLGQLLRVQTEMVFRDYKADGKGVPLNLFTLVPQEGETPLSEDEIIEVLQARQDAVRAVKAEDLADVKNIFLDELDRAVDEISKR